MARLLKLLGKAITWSLIVLHCLLISFGIAAFVTQADIFAKMFSDTLIAIGVNLGILAGDRKLNGGE